MSADKLCDNWVARMKLGANICIMKMNDPKIIKAVGDVAAVIFEVVTGESIKNVKVTDDGLKM